MSRPPIRSKTSRSRFACGSGPAREDSDQHALDGLSHVVWTSSASYRANADGVVDLHRAAATGGSYTGIWGMGLLSSMVPVGTAPYGVYSWSPRPLRFDITAREAHTPAAKLKCGADSRRTDRPAHGERAVEGVLRRVLGTCAIDSFARSPRVRGLGGRLVDVSAGRGARGARLSDARARVFPRARTAANAGADPARVLRQGAHLARGPSLTSMPHASRCSASRAEARRPCCSVFTIRSSFVRWSHRFRATSRTAASPRQELQPAAARRGR